jgi:hypothetical protein
MRYMPTIPFTLSWTTVLVIVFEMFTGELPSVPGVGRLAYDLYDRDNAAGLAGLLLLIGVVVAAMTTAAQRIWTKITNKVIA